MEFQGASANSGGEPAGRALERGASGCQPRPSAGRGGAQPPPLPPVRRRSPRGSVPPGEPGKAAAGERGGDGSSLRENGRGESPGSGESGVAPSWRPSAFGARADRAAFQT
ncbi:translation initiation factor IF-2-like [Aquila chrysaetos chrysaetos]|uniref:translation initiation factor IF-2-like n=1 Tax=Aquila chrysaetos chrysaetos TaxID=223781 RepID=UPI001176C54C|nr:translation initiation factor IF-2-like [Aquila chrysaetos chrysaetos]